MTSVYATENIPPTNVYKTATAALNTTETLMVRLFGKIFCESGLSGNLITYPGLSLQNFGVLSEHAES